jgi:hypothetical protein
MRPGDNRSDGIERLIGLPDSQSSNRFLTVEKAAGAHTGSLSEIA